VKVKTGTSPLPFTAAINISWKYFTGCVFYLRWKYFPNNGAEGFSLKRENIFIEQEFFKLQGVPSRSNSFFYWNSR
jgi:hypothetical protein